MHEAALVRDLVREVDSVARENSAGHVQTVRIEIGALSHVTRESLEGQFEVLAQGSAAQGAHLDITRSGARNAANASDVRIVSIVIEEG